MSTIEMVYSAQPAISPPHTNIGMPSGDGVIAGWRSSLGCLIIGRAGRLIPAHTYLCGPEDVPTKGRVPVLDIFKFGSRWGNQYTCRYLGLYMNGR